MATKVFIIIAVIVYVLFLMSALGPMHSKKKFWKAIYKIRKAMDLTSYWFFNICAIASILVAIVYFVLEGIFKG